MVVPGWAIFAASWHSGSRGICDQLSPGRIEKVVVELVGNNRGSRARAVEYTEHMPPDTTAAIFFLKNRRPDRWRDVQRIDAAMGHYVLSEFPMDEATWIRERTIADGGEPKTIEHEPDDRKSNS